MLNQGWKYGIWQPATKTSPSSSNTVWQDTGQVSIGSYGFWIFRDCTVPKKLQGTILSEGIWRGRHHLKHLRTLRKNWLTFRDDSRLWLLTIPRESATISRWVATTLSSDIMRRKDMNWRCRIFGEENSSSNAVTTKELLIFQGCKKRSGRRGRYVLHIP